MGSSAAALTVGVVIADQLLNLEWKPLRVLDEAARLEGHPDNVAACTLGSIVASAIDSGGGGRAVRPGPPAWTCRSALMSRLSCPILNSRRRIPVPCCPNATAPATRSLMCSAPHCS